MIILSSEVSLSPPKGLAFECKQVQVQGDANRASEKVLLMGYSGMFPLAKAGADHGRFIAASTVQALIKTEPFGLILDFRELEFTWGDSLFEVYAATEQFMEAGRKPPDLKQQSAPAVPFPVATVSSTKSQAGIQRLLKRRAYSLLQDHYDDVRLAAKAISERTVDWGMCSWRSVWERHTAAE